MEVPEVIQKRVADFVHGRMSKEEEKLFLQEVERSTELKEELFFQQQFKEDLGAVIFLDKFKEITEPEKSQTNEQEEEEIEKSESDWVEDVDTLFEVYFEPETEIPAVVNQNLDRILKKAQNFLTESDFQHALLAIEMAEDEQIDLDEEELIYYLKGNIQLAISPPEVEQAVDNLLSIRDIEEANLVESAKALYTLALAYLKKGEKEECVFLLQKLVNGNFNERITELSKELLMKLRDSKS